MGIYSDGRNRKLKENNFNEDIYNYNVSFNINNNSYNKNINDNSEIKQKKEKNVVQKDKKNNNDIHNIKPEKVVFPRGEHYYQLIKDSNKSEIIKKEDYSEKVELFFSLNHVKNPNDEHSFRISIINNARIGNITYLGKTENETGKEIKFGNSFLLDFHFEIEQILIIEPIINNSIIQNKKEEFALSKLMKRMDNKLSIIVEDIGILEINYKNKEKRNKELNDEASNFQFNITLNNNNIFNIEERFEGMYFVIRNVKDGKRKRPVYKSHEYYFKLNEKKKTYFISFGSNKLCNNDGDPIFFELYCPKYNEEECIGYCSFTIKQLKSSLEKDKLEQIEIRSKNNGKIGTLEINYSFSKIISLEHYIKNGQINLDIAIDYTESNGLPNDPNSLHYMKEEGGNDYEKAIKLFGKIMSNYNYEQLFSVYGFGGIPPNSDKISHCFNINFNDDNPEIETIENIIKYYRESLDKVKFYGPTCFPPLIKKVMSEINDELENKKEENHYHILLILTDGIITDMVKTVNCIVEASKLPLSIVIVGIGDYDFESYEVFDEDDIIPLVNSFGEISKRDIVQFVKFNNIKEMNTKDFSKDFAEEAFKEIPRQIEEYYKIYGKFYEYSLEN